MTVLIDSDVLIEVSRGRNSQLISIWHELSLTDAAILCSPVNVAELWSGARPSEHEVLEKLFEAIICVPIDRQVGRRAGSYLQQYRKSHGVEIADAFIAAAAVESEAALWTLNRKHYPMKELDFFR